MAKGSVRWVQWVLALLFLSGGTWGLRAAFAGSEQAFWREGNSAEEVQLDDDLRVFVRLSRELAPAVVNISTTRVMQKQPQGPPGSGQVPGEEEDRDFFEQFFRRHPSEPFHFSSLGSGFIIHPDGFIVTNNHVIEDTEDIRVTLTDDREFKAEVVGRDPKTDLALLKVDAENLPVVTLGDSDSLEIGEWVLAIGNPFGLDHSVTAGIVSAKGRNIGSGPYDDFIQTDASINPGNSGGPLFNTRGEVVGINTAIVSNGSGIGFAIPVNLAKELLPQIRLQGRVIRGWLGINIQDLDEELAKTFNLREGGGVLVSRVIPDHPADRAGIQGGDVILTFNGQEVRHAQDLQRLVASTPVGERVEVLIHHKGKEKSVWVTIAEMAEEARVASAPTPGEEGLGLSVEAVDRKLAMLLDIPPDTGVAVTEVVPGSPADRADIRLGDIILEIERQPVGGPSEYHDRVERGPATLLFLVRRGDATLFAPVKKE